MRTDSARRSASLGNLDDPSQPSQSSSASSTVSLRRTGFGSSAAVSATSPTSTAALRKRKRLVVSCQQCHRRKQKCDRNQPCKACVSRGMAGSCRYETAAMSRERHNTRISEAVAEPGISYPSHPRSAKVAKVAKATATTTTTAALDYSDAYMTNTHTDVFQQDGTPWYPPQSQPQPLHILPDTVPEVDAKLASTCRISMDHGPPLGGNAQTVADRYATQVRMLPPRVAVDRLVDMYFAKKHWQHSVLHEDVFRQQLVDWYGGGGWITATDDGLPVTQTLSPLTLAPEQRVFPALLFLVLATALLGLEADAEDDRTFFESIKNPPNATVNDLALDYGDAGIRILAVLGKRKMTPETVQAGFLWAAFLLDTSLITESWHALGSTIRDAQEIGLHSSSSSSSSSSSNSSRLGPRPHAQTDEASLLSQWEMQRRRQLWIVLVTWDLRMGALLGRQPTVDLDSEPALPVDCILPKTYVERAQMSVQLRGEADAPTLVTRALWAYAVAAPLREVLKMLQRPGSAQRQDSSQAAALHVQLTALEASVPASFRAVDPDARFDDEPGCSWMPAVRGDLAQACAFSRIALHRPYIVQRARSRTEVLKACVRTLSLQRAYFVLPKAKRWRMSALLYESFDALALMAVIYILFPREHLELLPDAVQHFRWSAERFEAFPDTFCLERPALDVLQAMNLRLRKALGIDFMGTDNAGLTAVAVGSAPVDELTLSNIDPSLKEEGPGTMSTGDDGTEATGTAATAATRNSRLESKENGAQQQVVPQQEHAEGGGEGEEAEAAGEPEEAESEEPRPALFPAGFDWTAVPPIFPTGDVAYNVLLGVSNGAVAWPADALRPAPAAHAAALADGGDGAEPGLFAGAFGDNSLWAVLNTYAYAPFAEAQAAAWPV